MNENPLDINWNERLRGAKYTTLRKSGRLHVRLFGGWGRVNGRGPTNKTLADVVWVMHAGPIPKGYLVHHTPDHNPAKERFNNFALERIDRHIPALPNKCVVEPACTSAKHQRVSTLSTVSTVADTVAKSGK